MSSTGNNGINISLDDAFNIMSLSDLSVDVFQEDTYLIGVIQRTLEALDIVENIDVIIRRVQGSQLKASGMSKRLHDNFPDTEISIDAGKLYDFFKTKLISKEPINTSSEKCTVTENMKIPEDKCNNVEEHGVKFFPITGYPFEYEQPNSEATELSIIDYENCIKVTEEFLNESNSALDEKIKIIKEVYGISICDPNNLFKRLKVFGDALQNINLNKIKEGNPYVVGWSFPLFIKKENKIWGFVTFYSEDLYYFNNDQASKKIKILKKYLLDFAQFAYSLELLFSSYESILEAKRDYNSKAYYRAAKAYESIKFYDKALSSYIEVCKQISQNEPDDWYKDINYFESLCRAVRRQLPCPVGDNYLDRLTDM